MRERKSPNETFSLNFAFSQLNLGDRHQKTAVQKFDSVIFVEKSYSIQLSSSTSFDETFKQRSNELKSYLNKRGNNLSFLNQEVTRLHNITRTQGLAYKDTLNNLSAATGHPLS